jgi:hypothetical protein
MAQKIQTLLIDDLDGGQAEGTVRFGLDGAEYEIDHWSHTLAPRAGRLDLLPAIQAEADVAQPPPPALTLQRSGSGPSLRASRSKTADGSPPNWSSSSRQRPSNSRAVARRYDIAP